MQLTLVVLPLLRGVLGRMAKRFFALCFLTVLV